jgi:Protein of unknown function (DUF1344)
MPRIVRSSDRHTPRWRLVRGLGALTSLLLALGTTVAGGPACAQPAADPGERQIESRIVNVNGEMIQLDDGTVVRVPHGLALQSDLREGKRVKVRYEVKDGKPVAKTIEFLQEPSGNKKP